MAVEAHNTKAQSVWNSPAGRYDEISRSISDAIEHAVVMTRGDSILPSDLPFGRDEAYAEEDGAPSGHRAFFGDALSELPFTQAKEKAALAFERAYVERLLKRTGNNVSEAARQAGMDRSNFRRLMKKVRAAEDDGLAEDGEA